jgi:hypothetical protein
MRRASFRSMSSEKDIDKENVGSSRGQPQESIPLPQLLPILSNVTPVPIGALSSLPEDDSHGPNEAYEGGNNGRQPSTPRIFLAGISMLLTYYLGVSWPSHRTYGST